MYLWELIRFLPAGRKVLRGKGENCFRELAERAAGRLDILAGAGIGPDVIRKTGGMYGGESPFICQGRRSLTAEWNSGGKGFQWGSRGSDEFDIWQTDKGADKESAAEVLKAGIGKQLKNRSSKCCLTNTKCMG